MIRLARFVVFAVLIFLVVSQAAQAATFRSLTLEAKLPTAIKVFCSDNTGASYAYLVEREIYLDTGTCEALLNGSPFMDPNGGYGWAYAAHVLYHEWWHIAFQTREEKQTECGAYAVYRYMLRTFWGLSEKDAQTMYRQSWAWTSYYAPLPCGETA